MQLRHAANTDNGRSRDHNEDAFAVDVSAEHAAAGALFVICDGMGGFASGEVASDLAVQTILASFYAADPSDPQAALRTAFRDANERVYREGRGKMGTTGVAALFRNGAVLVGNIGDSRAYVLRAGQIRQLTNDHSFVAEQVAAGVLSADQARESSYRNIITRAIGHRDAVEADLFHFPLRPLDRILLCSDGLHGVVEPDEIAQIAGSGKLERNVQALIALANERGGPDNITVVLVEVIDLQGEVAAKEIKTERMPGRGTTASMTSAPEQPRASAGVGAAQRPAQLRKPVLPPEPPARRGSILGMIFMILVSLALLGGLLWFALSTGIATPTVPATPRVPTLTPLNATTQPQTTPVPTLVPTAGPTVAPSDGATVY
jgi:PPM family protein phosphatase